MPLAARDAELADRREDHVLSGEAERQRADEVDLHRSRPGLRQRLGREDVLDLGRADPERESADGAVRRGVAVTADDRHARLREAELRTDHVDDPLATAAGREEPHVELVAVRTERVELLRGEGVRDRALGGRHVVIHCRHGQVGPADTPAVHAERLERLGARHLVDEMEVDPEQRRPVTAVGDEVGIPDLAKQRPLHLGVSAA